METETLFIIVYIFGQKGNNVWQQSLIYMSVIVHMHDARGTSRKSCNNSSSGPRLCQVTSLQHILFNSLLLLVHSCSLSKKNGPYILTFT